MQPTGAVEYDRKLKFLQDLPESKLDNEIVRPLLRALGFSYVTSPEGLGQTSVYTSAGILGDECTAVYVKAGDITGAHGAVGTAKQMVDHVKAAFATAIRIGKKRVTPLRAMVIASGTISRSITESLESEFGSARIELWDCESLVARLDEHFAVAWTNVDIHKHSYLRALAAQLTAESIPTQTLDGKSNEAFQNAATDARYVELTAFQVTTKPVTRRGKIVLLQDIEEVDVLDLPNRPEKQILLIGDAGAGKSTAMRRLAYVIAQRSLEQKDLLHIPVFLRAPDILAADCVGLIDCAAKLTVTSGIPDVPFDQADLTEGRVTFLIDALDEVAAERDRATVMKLVSDFARDFPECRIVISSRNYSSLIDLPGYGALKRLTIQDISIRQAEKLVANLAKASKPTDWQVTAANVLQRIQDVHGMGLNPLLVTVFVSTADDERPDIPANVTELFKKWSELMLGRWERSKGPSKQYQHAVKDFLLCEIAFRMHVDGQRLMELPRFTASISELLGRRGLSADIAELTDEILNRSGLLRIVGKNVEFRHHMIQEFFAGRGIPNIAFVKSVLGDEWWRAPIIFYFGENPGSGAGLREVFGAIDSAPGEEAMNASISLGLALQACYLTETSDRKEVFRKVIRTFAACEEDVVNLIGDPERFRNYAIAYYFFIGKDSVALHALTEFAEELIAETASMDGDLGDATTFWVLVGLLETYNFDHAEGLIRKFRPRDPRLLLALSMGCGLIEKTRSLKNQHRNRLKAIRTRLEARTEGIQQALFREIQLKLKEERNKMFKKALESHAGEQTQSKKLEIESKNGSHP